jgi:regulator of sigma E protease
MSLFIGIILALIVFFIVVFLHELWHFLVARWSGVRVHEFGLGIPPRLWRLFRDKQGTEWTLNWFPIWWFVRLKGENYDDPESHDRDALSEASWWKQVAILLAGVTMNFLLAGSLFAVLFYQGTEPLTIHIRELAPNALLSHVGPGTQLIPIFPTLADAEKSGVITRAPGVVLDPLPWSLAAQSGIIRWDVLLSINGTPIQTPQELQNILAQNRWTLEMTIQRWTETRSLTLTPNLGKIGAYIAPNISLVRYTYSPLSAVYHGMREVYYQIGFSFRTFGAIIKTSFSQTASHEQKQEATAGIGGPVAIGRIFVGLADYGVELRSVIVLTAMISLSLGVFNLLPLPALDGGRVFVILVNQIIHMIAPRFKISPRTEQIIHSLGFMILILASILITWKDIFMG